MEFNRQTQDRVRELDKLFRDPIGHTYDDIISILTSKGIPASKRTIQGDIQKIIASGVKFHFEKRGGHDKALIRYEDSSIPPVVGSFSSHERVTISRLLERSESPIYKFVTTLLKGLTDFDDIQDLSDYIDFGEAVELEGIENFEPILNACLNKKTISFLYKTFGGKVFSTKVFPYVLKMYNGRWFLICRSSGFSNLSVYSLDRIDGDVTIEDGILFEEYPEGRDVIFDSLRSTIGITDAFTKGNEVIKCDHLKLKVAAGRYAYIFTKPIHPYQELIENESTGQHKVIRIPIQTINKELVSLLLGFGADIEVLEPHSLRDYMKRVTEDISSIYK